MVRVVASEVRLRFLSVADLGLPCSLRADRTVHRGYKSTLVFGPFTPGQQAAGVLDIEHAAIPDLSARYGAVVQNLRIIRSPGTVVWSRSPRKWREAAVGMDGSGRLLFIFCRSPTRCTNSATAS